MQNQSLQKRISLAGCVNAAASLLAGKGATVEQLFKLAEQIMAELDKRAPVCRASVSFFDAEGRASRGKHKGATLAELPADYVQFLEKEEATKAEIAKLRAKTETSEEAPW